MDSKYFGPNDVNPSQMKFSQTAKSVSDKKVGLRNTFLAEFPSSVHTFVCCVCWVAADDSAAFQPFPWASVTLRDRSSAAPVWIYNDDKNISQPCNFCATSQICQRAAAVRCKPIPSRTPRIPEMTFTSRPTDASFFRFMNCIISSFVNSAGWWKNANDIIRLISDGSFSWVSNVCSSSYSKLSSVNSYIYRFVAEPQHCLPLGGVACRNYRVKAFYFNVNDFMMTVYYLKYECLSWRTMHQRVVNVAPMAEIPPPGGVADHKWLHQPKAWPCFPSNVCYVFNRFVPRAKRLVKNEERLTPLTVKENQLCQYWLRISWFLKLNIYSKPVKSYKNFRFGWIVNWVIKLCILREIDQHHNYFDSNLQKAVILWGVIDQRLQCPALDTGVRIRVTGRASQHSLSVTSLGKGLNSTVQSSVRSHWSLVSMNSQRKYHKKTLSRIHSSSSSMTSKCVFAVTSDDKSR